jgi:hypothetical protein
MTHRNLDEPVANQGVRHMGVEFLAAFARLAAYADLVGMQKLLARYHQAQDP